jgi:hypothetical protein
MDRTPDYGVGGMTSADLDRLDLALPIGAANGTTVRKLAHALGWPADGRKVREGIQTLRREYHVKIAALPKANGVFIVATEADLAALKRTRDGLHSRAMSELVTCRDLDQMIADLEWSPTLFSQLEEAS